MSKVVVPSVITSVVRSQQAHAQRVKNQTVHVFDQVGTADFIMSSKSCELMIDVNFTNTFIEKPTFTFGSELQGNQALTTGSFPQITATVVRWNSIYTGNGNGDTGTIAYVGATIAIVATGTSGLGMIIHYMFKGRGLAFPTSAMSGNATGVA